MKWVTESRPHVDRCACAWFVRRSVDRHASFVFVRRGDPVPRGATPFDLPGARFGHRGSRVSFDAFLDECPQKDPAFAKVADLVRDIDLGEFRLPESHGLDTLLYGIALVETDDTVVLEKTAPLFDALLRFYRDGAHE